MEYTLGEHQKNYKILIELLQNRFTKFNDSIVKWKFKDKNINSNFLEEKLIRTYENKNYDNSELSGDYSDWIDIFDTGLREINLTNKLPVVFFSGGKDSTFIASRLTQNKIHAVYISLITNNEEKKHN